MSTTSSFPMTRSLVALRRFLCLTLALLVMSADGQGQSNALVSIGVDRTDYVDLGDSVTLAVRLLDGSSQFSMGQMHLLLGFYGPALSLISVSPGSLLTNCGYEYFNYQHTPGANPTLYSTDLLRIDAAADVVSNPNHPSCYVGDTPGTLVELRFAVSPDLQFACFSIPLEFYWLDCDDNVIISATSDTTYYADRVYSAWNDYDWYLTPDSLPSYEGVPDSCVSFPGHTAGRYIDFHSGDVEIRCYDTLDLRGDLNINGIAYEIADAVVYTDYFLFGLGAFAVSVEEQIAASDVNADGNTLTFRDLIYLVRVILGDVVPIPKGHLQSSLTAGFTQDFAAKTVTVDFNGFLAGAYVVFQGLITPEVLWPQDSALFGFGYRQDTTGNLTNIVIFPSDREDYVSGPMMSYTGEGVLLYVETTDWFDSPLAAQISYTNSSYACGDLNASGQVDITDAVYYVNYIFSGGVPPADLSGGDLNCDGIANITDVVYLLRFLMASGSPPCAACP